MNATAKPSSQQPEPIVALARIAPKYKGERTGAAFYVEVDGIRWADVFRESHGSRGYSYTFRQLSGDDGGIHGTISRPRAKPMRNGRTEDEIVIRSQSEKHKRVEAIFGREPADKRTTEEIIVDTAKALIAEGLMISPAEQKARTERSNARSQERQKKAAELAEAALRSRARECLAIPGDNGITAITAQQTEMIERIVAAMKWAQTQ